VTGTLFSLPAGEVKASVSAVYREDSVNYIPSISIVTNDALGLNPSNPSSGETDTVELGGEVLVPLFADSFNLTAGYRYSDQDISGSGNSWNVGLEWRPTESFFVRGSYQQAIRAPNIGELYSAALGSEFTVGDPTTNPAAGDPCDIRTVYRTGPDGDEVAEICVAQGIPEALVDTFQHTTTALPASTGGNTGLDRNPPTRSPSGSFGSRISRTTTSPSRSTTGTSRLTTSSRRSTARRYSSGASMSRSTRLSIRPTSSAS
jgi:hypothetical protein